MARKAGDPSPEQLAKINRQRVDREDGARALEEVARRDIAVRRNMARLRELRLAKEAEGRIPSEARGKRAKKT
jgi:hypothetical protein